MADKKRLGFSVSLDASLPAVIRGDGLRLRQVLGNLISNALKFTQRGEVQVELSRGNDEQLRCTVTDTGIGVSPEQLQRLFTRFVQAGMDDFLSKPVTRERLLGVLMSDVAQ